jgi:TolB protein
MDLEKSSKVVAFVAGVITLLSLIVGLLLGDQGKRGQVIAVSVFAFLLALLVYISADRTRKSFYGANGKLRKTRFPIWGFVLLATIFILLLAILVGIVLIPTAIPAAKPTPITAVTSQPSLTATPQPPTPTSSQTATQTISPTSTPEPSATPTPTPTETHTPTITPTPTPLGNSRGLAFISYRNGNADIFLLSEDGLTVNRIAGGLEDDNWPSWSPDGNRLAFISHKPDKEAIIVANADGTDAKTITGLMDAKFFSHPSWASDGKRIAFGLRFPPREFYDMYYISADGTNWVGIVQPPNIKSQLGSAWSPNGAFIAFHYINSAQTESSIYLYSFVTNGLAQLTPNGNVDVDPAWSPDSRSIAFSRNGDIWVMNPDGTNQRQLTNTPSQEVAPSWSPDGRLIAYQTNQDGNWEIYILAVDDSIAPRNVTNNPDSDIQPAWRP